MSELEGADEYYEKPLSAWYSQRKRMSVTKRKWALRRARLKKLREQK